MYLEIGKKSTERWKRFIFHRGKVGVRGKFAQCHRFAFVHRTAFGFRLRFSLPSGVFLWLRRYRVSPCGHSCRPVVCQSGTNARGFDGQTHLRQSHALRVLPVISSPHTVAPKNFLRASSSIFSRLFS